MAEGSSAAPGPWPAESPPGAAPIAPRAAGGCGTNRAECVLVCAADDGARVAALLHEARLHGEACPSVAEVGRRLREAAGAAVLAEELLTDAALAELLAARADEPPWSDFPFLVLAAAEHRPERLEPLGNVLVVERPVRGPALHSAVRAALRARRRQYQARDQLAERARLDQARRDAEARFRQLADHLPAGFLYEVVEDAPGRARFTYVSAGAESLVGVTAADLVADPLALYRRVLPEDQPRLRAAEEAAGRRRTAFECQFRTRGPGDTVRWLHCRSAPRPQPDGTVVWDGIAADITEVKEMEQSLRAADRRKDEFLAMLAHELRNPLAPIRNAVHIIRLLDLPGDDLAWARDVIDRQTQQLSRLVDDLLDVSRISRGKVELRKQRVALAEVLSRGIETARPLIEARRHALEIALPPAPVALEADSTRLAQVVGNLLTNAAKYTPEGGRIVLTAEAGTAASGAAEVVVRVRDTGIGIPADMLDRVFELFTQVDQSLSRAEGGLGIGLTLVRSLLEQHGGTVTAHSAGPGHGSEFVVRLPRGSVGEW